MRINESGPESTKGGDLLKNRKAQALSLLLAAVVAGGSARVAVAEPNAPRAVAAETGHQPTAVEYFESPARNARIKNFATKLAKRFIRQGEPGGSVYGEMKAYNPNTDTWGLTNNRGWVWRQADVHGYEVITAVYQRSDGTLDLSKGVQEFSIGKIGRGDIPVAEFESPDYNRLIIDSTSPKQPAWASSWDLLRAGEKGVHFTDPFGFDQSLTRIKQIDHRAEYIAERLSDKAGL